MLIVSMDVSCRRCCALHMRSEPWTEVAKDARSSPRESCTPPANQRRAGVLPLPWRPRALCDSTTGQATLPPPSAEHPTPPPWPLGNLGMLRASALQGRVSITCPTADLPPKLQPTSPHRHHAPPRLDPQGPGDRSLLRPAAQRLLLHRRPLQTLQ